MKKQLICAAATTILGGRLGGISRQGGLQVGLQVVEGGGDRRAAAAAAGQVRLGRRLHHGTSTAGTYTNASITAEAGHVREGEGREGPEEVFVAGGAVEAGSAAGGRAAGRGGADPPDAAAEGGGARGGGIIDIVRRPGGGGGPVTSIPSP